MARVTNQKPDAAGRRVKKSGEPPMASYAEKNITPTMQAFCEWIEEQTGYKPDPMSVQLSGVLRSTFQKSDFNQNRLAERKAEKERIAQEIADRKAARAEAKAERAAARAAKAAEPKPEKKTATVSKASAKAAPAKKASAAPKAAPAKRTAAPAKKSTVPTATRRRAAKPAGDDADF